MNRVTLMGYAILFSLGLGVGFFFANSGEDKEKHLQPSHEEVEVLRTEKQQLQHSYEQAKERINALETERLEAQSAEKGMSLFHSDTLPEDTTEEDAEASPAPTPTPSEVAAAPQASDMDEDPYGSTPPPRPTGLKLSSQQAQPLSAAELHRLKNAKISSLPKALRSAKVVKRNDPIIQTLAGTYRGAIQFNKPRKGEWLIQLRISGAQEKLKRGVAAVKIEIWRNQRLWRSCAGPVEQSVFLRSTESEFLLPCDEDLALQLIPSADRRSLLAHYFEWGKSNKWVLSGAARLSR